MDHDPHRRTAVFHRQSRTLFISLMLAFTIITLIFAFVFGDTFYLVIAVADVLIVIDVFRKRLLVTEQGLEYRAFFTTKRARWTDVKSIVTKGLLFAQEYLCITTESPESGEEEFIPLSYFDKSWKDHILGAILRERVPHIFA